MNIRKLLIDLRAEKSQESIAKELGITQKHLSAIELGNRNPSFNLMNKFESYYNKKIQDLFPDIFLK